MKKIVLILLAMLLTTTLAFGSWHVDEGFEGGAIPGDWTVIDEDGDGLQWVAFENAIAHSGDWVATVEAYSSNDGIDWLITPQVTIESGDSFIFWARAWYGTEDFFVRVSIDDPVIGDFDDELDEVTGLGSSWTQYSYDLSSYAGQDIYLAIEWNVDTYCLVVDDVKVGQEAVPAPNPPVATAATTDGTLTFFANWNASTGATGYYLDVATDLSGYENLDVGDVTTYSVTALSAADHYYRLRAYNASGTSGNSNVIAVLGSTLPVELSAFTATLTGNYTMIRWVTASETDVNGFNIYRGTENEYGTSEKINIQLIPGYGTTTEPQDYEFQDLYQLNYETTYYYWLESVNLDGGSNVFGSIEYTPETGQGGYEDDFDNNLLMNQPNPFASSTTINYAIKGMLKSEPVKISIYNTLGQLILEDVATNGVYQFDASNLPTGVYFYRLITESYSNIKKMMIIR